ncbi:MAG: SGNH/GDSL hydrolase family protein [Planctomycetes bacterium]|nr:SGNH/GDSL hydrolase family protein [Planctomycetota bacterium]
MPTPQPTPTPRKRLLPAFVGMAACAVVLGGLELGLRLGGFGYEPAADPIVIWNSAEDRELRIGRGLHRPAVRQLWEPRPGAPLPEAWAPLGETVNPAGFRGPSRDRARAPGTLRIATLGDSSTFGYGVPYKDTYSARLEAELSSAGLAAEVLDFGVVGYTLLQGIERYVARVREWQPDVVVAAFGSVNEHLLAQGAPDVEKVAALAEPGGLSAVLRRARSSSRAVQLAARCLDGMAARRVEEAAALERRRAESEAELAPFVGQPDLESAHQGRRRVSLEEFRAGLERLEQLVRADGAVLVLVSLPRRPGVEFNSPVLRSYSQAIVDHAAASGAALYDGRADFRAYREVEHGDPSMLFLEGDDVHPGVRGHRRLARGLAAVVRQARPVR